MRAALRALVPPLLCGAVFFTTFDPQIVPAFLAMCYGLGLLATGHFAPYSIVGLGWSFLLSGLAIFLGIVFAPHSFAAPPDVIMAATFGGFHLIYAACTWPRGAQTAAASVTP